MTNLDASRAAFEAWVSTLPLSVQVNINESLAREESYTFKSWQASRKAALEEATDQADEWSNYVIEDTAPETLRARMEKLK